MNWQNPRRLFRFLTAFLFFSVLTGFSPLIHGQTLPPATRTWRTVIGSDRGLYGMDRLGIVTPLWTGGTVRKILQTPSYWALLGDKGVMVSTDLVNWEERNRGLPVKTVKNYEDGKKSFISVAQEIKDLEFHPENPDIMVCATKDTVYLSRDAGRNWESLGLPPYRTNGIKAVAAANLPGAAQGASNLTIFVSHSTYGIHYRFPDVRGAAWTELNRGLEQLETTSNPDEVSDIAVTVSQSAAGNALTQIYVSQTFRRRIYQLDWEQKRFTPLWSDASAFGTVDSLDINSRNIRFLQEGAVMELAVSGSPSRSARQRLDIASMVRNAAASRSFKPTSIISWGNGMQPDAEPVKLSELWLLEAEPMAKFPANGARGRQGLYLPVNHAMDSYSLKPYLDVISGKGLDMVVIDMKDDYGRLRFTPNNQSISEKGRVFRPVDIDGFLKNMKALGIYTVARIVVFKDPELARKEGGRYAVWDSRNNKPWAGYYDQRRLRDPNLAEEKSAYETEILPADDPAYEILRTYYDERWVDPYSEVVWDYTASVAKELHERGFDEIQFDYIRFPTDGVNLDNAQYRWREAGMDMESAILSFLRHTRARIDAPISIDIYGANGWYRTGARTGQEVELLAPYVDVICPMYYPSHFEQDFLAQAPAELRPYRIYYQGIQRTERIGRGQIIVRPYAQAFFLNVSYDRQYYNTDYVRLQAEGVRDAGSPGLTYWNNSGRYDDIPVSVSEN
jgi:hypothetical protein